jgi:iron uptake system EfeUOB component EfeO/EfeM
MVSINEAFRLRNRLKEKIRQLTEMVKNVEYEKTKGEEENCAGLDGLTLKDSLAKLDGLISLLNDFNTAIEMANNVNRPALIKLDTLRAKTALYQKILEKCRECKGYEYVEQYSQNPVKVLKEPVIDQSEVVRRLAYLNKEMNEVEESLAKSNYETKVDFDTGTIVEAII